MIEFSRQDLTDIKNGLIIAMKELDKHKGGADEKLADRLEIIVDTKIDNALYSS